MDETTTPYRIERPTLLSTSPLSLLAMLWRRKTAILVLYSIFGAIGAGVVLKWPDRYRSETVILVDGQKIPDKLVSTTVNKELQDRIATISKQILSSTNLLKVISDFNFYKVERDTLVQEQVLELMRSDIDIRWRRAGPKIVRALFVSYSGPSPSVVAAVATRLGNLFIEENLKSREVEAEGTSEFLKGRLQEAKQVLDVQEEKVRQYKEQCNGQLPDQGVSVEQTFARLESQLQNTQELLVRAQETKRSAESSLGTAEGSYAVMTQLADRSMRESGLTEDPHAEARRKQKFLKSRLAELQVTYSDNHPDVKATKVLLAKVSNIQSIPAPAKPDAPANSLADMPLPTAQLLARERERIETLKSQVKSTEREVEQRELERRKLVSDLALYQKRMEQLPVREQEVSAMMRDYETSQMHYRSLLDKIFAAETAAEMERRQKAERFTILDPDRVPEKPFSPNRQRLACIGAAASLVIALCIGLGWEMRKNRLMGEWELPEGVQILGRIPAAGGPETQRRRTLGPLVATAAASASALALVCVTAVQIYRG